MNSPSTSRTNLKLLALVAQVAIVVVGCARLAAAQPAAERPPASPPPMALLGLPAADGPVAVNASFQLLSINVIGDETESVAFSGVLTLVWKDERQAFDATAEGTREKVYSGAYQFNEIAPGWYPQVTLANVSGQYDSHAIILRVQPDGTSTLRQEIEAVAKVNLDMWRFPFDRQQLELIFMVIGYSARELELQASPDAASASNAVTKVPQWTLQGVTASTRTLHAQGSSKAGPQSALVVALNVKRQPLFMLRMVVLPLALIVVLSWSVFWMDRSSVGDRMSVSFVGILTAVAYQITLAGIVPNVSAFTYMNAFLNLSFVLMSATVVVNLYVGAADRRGHHQHGDRIDRRCRWLFPLAYLGFNALALAVALLPA
jgi:hypothetical protein